jgi:hypothetical protein
VARVSRFGTQNLQLRFGDLDVKITATVSSFEPQNQAGFGFLIVPQNRRSEDGAGQASRSSGLLRLEASHTMVSQSDLKTVGGTMVGDACDTIVKIASGSS